MTDAEKPRPYTVLMGDWEFTVHWLTVKGVPQVVGLDIHSFVTDDEGRVGPVAQDYAVVTKHLLKGLPWEGSQRGLEGIRETARRGLFMDEASRAARSPSKAEQAAGRERAKALLAGQRPSYDRSHYQRVADIYNAARASGAKPRVAVRDALWHDKNDPEKGRIWASNQVAAAKRLGLITDESEQS